jgi:parvulin-like peptidyl-prolyl cis-trans isomerase-like protein/SurA-like protein
MMRFFRKHRNTLMIVIAVLAIPFIFYFNKTDLSAPGQRDFGMFFDRKISAVEAQRYVRLLGLATQLGMNDFIQDLSGGARDENERAGAFIYNLLILRREADRLGLDASQAQRVQFVRDLRVFHGPNSGFDVGRYTEFTQQFLSPNGFTDAQVEELARDEIALRRIKELVAVGVSVPQTETEENYERAYGRLTASVIHLHNADFAKDVKISDDDVKKFYDARKAELKTDEKRKVDFVRLVLNDEEKKLTGKQKVEALQKLADKATDLTQALLDKGTTFQQAAAKFQLTPETTGEFAAGKPDPKLGAEPQVSAAAFQLTQEEPNSEPVQVADGYLVMHLAGIDPSRPLTLDEAKPKIVESLTANRARQAMTTKAAQTVHDLREGLKAGEPLSFAAEKVNVKAQQLPPFTLMEDDAAEGDKAKDKPKDLMAVKNAVAALQPGDVSEFFPWEDGGIIAVLEKREPPDEAKYGPKKKELGDRITTNKREIAFFEWLREKQREAGILKAPESDPSKAS